jgi:arylsulfatase A-like enzyme
VIADQLRSSAVGCYGNSTVQTPNIDRLASSGTRFSNAFALSPVCSPCRAQMLSGKYGTRPNIRRKFPGSPFLYKLPHEETTLAELLSRAGYATGMIGKWHISPKFSGLDGRSIPPPLVPPGVPRQGFAHWIMSHPTRGHYDIPYFFGDEDEGRVIPGFSCELETDWALKFLAQERQEPFFLMLSWNPPHNPYQPPPAFDLYPPADIPLRPNVPEVYRSQAQQSLAGYYGLITAVDHHLGRILEGLDRLGLSENTVVVFVSDHGDSLYSQRGETDRFFHKRTPWSEAAHVPLIIRNGGMSPAAGGVSDALVGSIDLMPTLLELAGVPIPEDVQGRSLAPLLQGRQYTPRESIFLHMTSTAGLPYGTPWRAVRTRDSWYAVSGGHRSDGWLLYDLKEDPYELRNLVAEPPKTTRRQELQDELRAWQLQLGDSLRLESYRPRA